MPVDCGTEIVLAFLDDPTSAPGDGCIDRSPSPNWTDDEDAAEIAFEPFEVTGIVAVSGVRPEGWLDVGAGTFARQRTALDPTTLVVQPTAGLPADALIGLLSTQLGGDIERTDDIELEGTSYASYAGSVDQGEVRAVIREGGDGVLILLVAEADEIDQLFDQLMAPVASAAKPG